MANQDELAKKAKYEIHSEGDQFYWRFIHNGSSVAASKLYDDAEACRESISNIATSDGCKVINKTKRE